jgi:hypothetical protein
VLGRGIERLARRRPEAGERDDVDHVAPARLAHRLERRQGAVDRSQRVDLEQRPSGLGVVLPDVAGDQDARVVDPHVERPRSLGRHRRRGAACLGVADVERRPVRRRPDLAGGGLGRLGVDVGQVDGESPRGQRPGDLEPEAPSGTGDQRGGHGESIWAGSSRGGERRISDR